MQVNSPASLFVTIINGGAETGTNCRIESDPSVSAALTYQTTDPVTNAPTGFVGTPVTLEPGAAQSFVVVLTPSVETAPTEVALGFLCDNAPQVVSISGVNTFDFSASVSPVADIVALGLTPTADGIVTVPTTSRINAFSVASVNLGATATVQVQAQLSNPQLAADLSICETNPVSGACINPSTPTSEPITTTIESMATPTFAVFVTTNGTLQFDPAATRISVRFADENEAVRGSTSVALRSRELIALSASSLQGTTLWSAIPQPGFITDRSDGQTFSSDGTGTTFESRLNFASDLGQAREVYDFTWTIDGAGELNQQFQDYRIIEVLLNQSDVNLLQEQYGMPAEQTQFLQNLAATAQISSLLDVERNVVSRKTTALSLSAGKFQVSTSTTEFYTMDAMLLRNGWAGELARGTPQVTTISEQVVIADLVTQAQGQQAASGETWAVPFSFTPQDPLVSRMNEGFYTDALTLLADGTTSTGRLSGESFSWENQGNTLVLTSGDNEYRYTTIELISGERSALIEYRLAGETLMIAGREIALADGTGSNLAVDLVQSGSLYWQVGMGRRAVDNFGDNGLLLPSSVFGYQFLDGSTANRIFNALPGRSECADETFGCFFPSSQIWDWSSEEDFIVRSFDDSLQARVRTWEVLSYTPGGSAIVLESEIISVQNRPHEFIILPRLNTLKLTDLQSWPTEFENSLGFN